MTFPPAAYDDILDAIEADYREPRPWGEPSRVGEAFARHRQPFAEAVPAGWKIYPGVPAKMQQRAASSRQEWWPWLRGSTHPT
jgi:hypothetical protein